MKEMFVVEKNIIKLGAKIIEYSNGKVFLMLSAYGKSGDEYDALRLKFMSNRNNPLILILREAVRGVADEGIINSYCISVGPDVYDFEAAIDAINNRVQCRSQMTKIPLVASVRCFERTNPLSRLLRTMNRFLDVGDQVNVGEVTTMSWDHGNTLAVPYEWEGNNGYLLYKEILPSLVSAGLLNP